MRKLKKLWQKGQAALILVLVMAIALGFGLSIISQSTTDVRISEQEQEASRAFNAAEAGIEKALKDLSAVPVPFEFEGVAVDYDVTGENFLEGAYSENESAQVELGNQANTITVEWVKSDSDVENPKDCVKVSAGTGQTAASLLITVVDSSNSLRRFGWNACKLNKENNLTDVTTEGTDGYLRSSQLTVTDNDVYLRIKPIYNQTSLKVSGANALPEQAYQIDSKAQATGLESKAIQVTRTAPATPSIFDYVLFSGSNIVK